MSSIYSPRLKCGVCANVRILHSTCKQCGILCEDCSGFHSKGNAFKNHNVVPLTFSDKIETSSIKMEPSIQLDLRDNIPITTCIKPPDVASTSTNAPTVYAPSTSNAPKPVYGLLTSNAPKPVYGLLTSNAPKPGEVMSSMYSPRLKCGVCADLSILYSHCKQCGNLCENCSGHHSKGNAFKNHNVVPLTFSDGMETSSIKVEPSTQLDHLDSTPTATCTTTADLLSTATNAPRPAYAPSTSSNSPTRDYASSTSSNDPTSHNVPSTSTNAPTSHNVPSTSNAPNTPKKKGVKRKATSVMKDTPKKKGVKRKASSVMKDTPKKKGVKRKATSVIKGMKKAACPQSKHQSNTVDLCCQDCDQAICSQCLKTAHTGHRIGDITDFFGKKRAMIESDLDLIQSHIQQREEAKQQLAEDLKKMEQASENVVKEVKDFADKMRSTILKKADDLKASTKETKKRIISRNGEFVKEIKKLETLRKKCQDELDSKDLAEILFRKETTFSLDTYENLPSSFKITPAAFFPAELDQDIMKSFGTIVSETMQEEPIAFRPPSTPIKMSGKKKKQTAQSSTPFPVPTATSASAQNREILSFIGKELGMNIVQQ